MAQYTLRMESINIAMKRIGLGHPDLAILLVN